MRFHKVEVDDEVFQFVKVHAEPLVDDFNSALKRLLPLSSDFQTQKKAQISIKEQPSGSENYLSSLPMHIPHALKQILDVVRLVRNGAYNRTTATQYVARRYNIFPQTVLDKYCRQLNLTASEFDGLLEKPDLNELRKILKEKFPDHAQIIEEILN